MITTDYVHTHIFTFTKSYQTSGLLSINNLKIHLIFIFLPKNMTSFHIPHLLILPSKETEISKLLYRQQDHSTEVPVIFTKQSPGTF